MRLLDTLSASHGHLIKCCKFCILFGLFSPIPFENNTGVQLTTELEVCLKILLYICLKIVSHFQGPCIRSMQKCKILIHFDANVKQSFQLALAHIKAINICIFV